MKKIFGLIMVLTLLGCSSSRYHQLDAGQQGFLPAFSTPVKVTVNHAIDTHPYKRMVYVSTRMHGLSDWVTYQDYIYQAFRHMNFFDKVVTRQPTAYINAPAMPATQVVNNQTWLDVEDHIPVSSLLNTYGTHFLIADVELYQRSTDADHASSYFFQVKLIDPLTRRVLVQASTQSQEREGIDKTLINPVLNYILGYLYYYDPAYPKPDLGPKNFGQWWEQMNDGFVNTFYFPDPNAVR